VSGQGTKGISRVFSRETLTPNFSPGGRGEFASGSLPLVFRDEHAARTARWVEDAPEGVVSPRWRESSETFISSSLRSGLVKRL
jgi:hypothetical protein